MSRVLVGLALALVASWSGANAQPVPDRVGDTYEIRLQHETRSEASDGSRSSSSQGGHHIIERVIAVRDEGLELEFDFPPDTTEQERSREWALPARVLRTSSGDFQLLNHAELEQRIDAWLTRGGIPREACGQWIFTWTAFKIECDPQSVIATLEPFDLRPDLRDGALYALPGAIGPAPLQVIRTDETGASYATTAQLDPELIRSERDDAEAIVAQITSGAASPEDRSAEDAFQAPVLVQIEGSISMVIETDAAGRVISRVTTIELDTVDAEGVIEHETRTESVRRELVSSASPG